MVLDCAGLPLDVIEANSHCQSDLILCALLMGDFETHIASGSVSK